MENVQNESHLCSINTQIQLSCLKSVLLQIAKRFDLIRIYLRNERKKDGLISISIFNFVFIAASWAMTINSIDCWSIVCLQCCLCQHKLSWISLEQQWKFKDAVSFKWWWFWSIVFNRKGGRNPFFNRFKLWERGRPLIIGVYVYSSGDFCSKMLIWCF